MELLFARLPEDLQLHAIKQTARFVTTTTLASVTNEASLICNAAAWAAPEPATQLLLKPLLNRIEEEVRYDSTTGAGRMSKVMYAALVLCCAMPCCGVLVQLCTILCHAVPCCAMRKYTQLAKDTFTAVCITWPGYIRAFPNGIPWYGNANIRVSHLERL